MGHLIQFCTKVLLKYKFVAQSQYENRIPFFERAKLTMNHTIFR